MEIGIVSSRYPVGLKHDAGRAVCLFATGLAALGHKVTVYTYNGSRMTMKYWEKPNLQVVSIGVIASMAIKSGLIYEDADAWNEGIWAEMEHQDTTQLLMVFDWFGFAAAQMHKEQYGSTIVGVVGTLASGRGQFIPFTDAARLIAFKAKELHFLANSDSLIAFNKCSAVEIGKLTNVPCKIINLGVHPITVERNPIPGNVLVVGRISREKVLEATLRSIVDNYWVELTLCGTGENTDYGKYIAKLAQKLDVANRLHFAEGATEQFYAKAEMVVCPSIYDPFGYQVLDAYNNCVPTIGHFMSYSDLIKNKDTGYSYQSVGDLSKTLNLIHGSNALRKQLAISGKAEVVEHYSLTRSIENMDHYLMQVTDGAYKQ